MGAEVAARLAGASGIALDTLVARIGSVFPAAAGRSDTELAAIPPSMGVEVVWAVSGDRLPIVSVRFAEVTCSLVHHTFGPPRY
ncbi:MAG: hypothetical protein QOJ56_1492 [Mycobacterium sp.]|jgi:hypothetical protein|nr:hypothetical protein [Mycobacterium sp.]MDT5352960.1 hypothetical protein [Mycobacterium sp.]MDT7720840.1 hypothetical protein [Mycobacterium sp.]